MELKGDATDFKKLAVSLTEQLAMCIGQAGYFEAVVATRDILALELGITAAELGDAADAELRGIIFGLLASAVGSI